MIQARHRAAARGTCSRHFGQARDYHPQLEALACGTDDERQGAVDRWRQYVEEQPQLEV